MKTFKQLREEGAIAAGPANAVSTGAIAGTGGKAGEPGVTPKKKTPIIMNITRKPPKV